MKKYVCFLLVLFTCTLFSCYGVNDSAHTEKPSDKEAVPLDKLLTQEYKLDDLLDFFEGANGNVPENFKIITKNLSYKDVDERFPIEVLRIPGGYSVYKVTEGGYFYVFWCKTYSDTESIVLDEELSSENMTVYFTSYLDSSMSLSEFELLKTGISTAADVKAVDPFFEMNLLLSHANYSYSYLNKDTLLSVKYKRSSSDIGYEDLIIESVEVVDRSSVPSRYSVVLDEDLPGEK